MTGTAQSVDDVAVGNAEVTVENVGGIDHCELTVEPGVTVLTGRNATNRTSLLSAIGGVLGGSTASLKSDAAEGRVTLAIGGETYAVTYDRVGGEVRTRGTRFSTDGAYVDQFVSLLEDNPARRAVERGDDLREVIMQPVDTDAIEDRIAELREELAALDDELDRVERRRGRLPGLEERRETLADEIDDLDDEVAALREEAADIEGELGEGEESNELVADLERRRTERTDLENELEVTRAERDALQEDLAEIETELETLPDVSAADVEAVEREVEAARERKRSLDEAITAVSTIVEFNEELLGGGRALPGVEVAGDGVVSELAPDADREVDCWTCGSRVEREAIADRLDDLRAVGNEKRDERGELANEIDELADRLEEYRESIERRETLNERAARTREKIEEREAELAELRGDAEALDDAIADLEAAVAETRELRESDLPSTYERISDLEFERGRLEREREEVDAEIEEIEALPEPATLEDRREELRSELEAKRGRIADLESSAVEAFNDHMDELLGLLGYENLARVWIERIRLGSGEPAEFELHVVRESSGSGGYEDVVDHLSESERELVGLVVALAGYLVHEVHRSVPFMLLDSLESIDAERIAELVEYFAGFAPYLIVALLPEDAAALDEDHHRITADAFQ